MSKSIGEETLALELWAAFGKDGRCVREFRFHPTRRWRFDFAWPNEKLAVEVEGGAWTGGHKRGTAADSDCEKANRAALMGWMVLRFTPGMVERGEALPAIREALTACAPVARSLST